MLRDCCPEIQALPAEELLRRYRKEAQVAELAHAASRNHHVVSHSCISEGFRTDAEFEHVELEPKALPVHKKWSQTHPKVTMKEASSEVLSWLHQHAGPRAAVGPQRLADWHHGAQDRSLARGGAKDAGTHPREPCVCMTWRRRWVWGVAAG